MHQGRIDPEKKRRMGAVLNQAFPVHTLEELDALSRQRPLTDLEVRRLERAVRRSAGKRERWHWSRADDYRLVRYLLRGKKPKQIAILMKRTEVAIWTRIDAFGLSVRKIERRPWVEGPGSGRPKQNCPIANQEEK